MGPRALVLAALAVVHVGCTTLTPSYTGSFESDETEVINFNTPRYERSISWLGWGSMAAGTAAGAYGGYIFKPNIQYTHGDTIERLKPVGKAILGGLAGAVISVGVNLILNKTEPPSVTEAGADDWLDRLDDGLVRVNRGSQYSTGALGRISAVPRSSERSFPLRSLSDARIFNEAFPSSPALDSLLNASADVMQRSDIPAVVTLFSSSASVPTLKAAYVRRSATVDDCIEAARTYPELSAEAQQRAGELIRTVADASRFSDAYPTADRTTLRDKAFALVATADDAGIFVQYYSEPRLNDSILGRLIPRASRQDLLKLVKHFPSEPRSAEARRRYAQMSETVEQAVMAAKTYPDQSGAAARRAFELADHVTELRDALAAFPSAPGSQSARASLERIEADYDARLNDLGGLLDRTISLINRALKGNGAARREVENLDMNQAARVRQRVDEVKMYFNERQKDRLAEIERKGIEMQEKVAQLAAAESYSAPPAGGGSGGRTSNPKIDRMLRDYEKLTNRYIALMKKVKRGDLSAMRDYASVLQSASTLQAEIGQYAGELTTSQMNRFLALQQKLANASSGF